jgi:hypothetical protein
MADMRTATAAQDTSLQRLAWEEINEPGAYVDVATGNLYRVSPETLGRGVASLVKEARAPGPQLVQLSRDPSIFPLGARILCARHHIAPNF